jgi:hypothetical protein
VVDALSMIREQNILVRHAEGLRISFIVVDDQGFIFALPPLLVEGARQGGNHPNAVRASSDQIETLVNAVLPTTPQRSLPLDVPAAVSTGNIDSVNGSAQLAYAEIGQKVAAPAQIDKIEQAIKTTPLTSPASSMFLQPTFSSMSLRFEVLKFRTNPSSFRNPSLALSGTSPRATGYGPPLS